MNSSQSLDMSTDTIKEYNVKNTYTNKVCYTLQLGGSWNLVTSNSRVGEGEGGGGERGEKQNKCKDKKTSHTEGLITEILQSRHNRKTGHACSI